MSKFLHMHHAMANKAMRIEAQESADFWSVDSAKLREIVMSGRADTKLGPVTVDDRETVLRYLAA